MQKKKTETKSGTGQKKKLKVGGNEKVELADKKLEAWKAELLEGEDEKFSTIFSEVVSKVNKVKLKDRNTEHEISEVDKRMK